MKKFEASIFRPTFQQKSSMGNKVIVVLENCYLESAKIKDEVRLLSADEHSKFLQKFGKRSDLYRPDIVHQCLLTLLDSPLNKANCLEVYLHTHNNVIIKVSPQCRIPRTYKRFAGLIVQCLFKLVIRADASQTASTSAPPSHKKIEKPDRMRNKWKKNHDKYEEEEEEEELDREYVDGLVLMKVMKNPITKHLPMGAPVFCCSQYAKETLHMRQFVDQQIEKYKQSKQFVFVVGGFSETEKPLEDLVKSTYDNPTFVSVSNYPLSASVVCSKVCNAFEEVWNVL